MKEPVNMKSAICLFVVLFAVSLPGAPALSGTAAGSQSRAPSPTPPGALAPVPAGTTPQANASVGAPALATSSSFNAAALTNGLAGFGFTNQFGTNFTSGDLSSVLLELQNSLQQALSLLGSFNGSLPIGGGTLGIGGGTTSLAGTLSSAGQNLATGGGVNLAANLAQNVATPTTSVAPPATPSSVFSQPTQAPVPPGALAPPVATATNISGVPVTPGTSNLVNGTVALNDSVRLLIILQNDMERLLPEVAQATGAPFILPLANGGFATNSFTTGRSNTMVGSSAGVLSTGTTRIPARSSAARSPRALTPTGR
jgi:hypothetical protein